MTSAKHSATAITCAAGRMRIDAPALARRTQDLSGPDSRLRSQTFMTQPLVITAACDDSPLPLQTLPRETRPSAPLETRGLMGNLWGWLDAKDTPWRCRCVIN